MIPTTPKDLLAFEWSFEDADFTDNAIQWPLALIDEDDQDHKLRRALFVREYELAHAENQKRYVEAVYDTLHEAWENQQVLPGVGLLKMNTLKADIQAMIHRIQRFEKELAETKKDHDEHFTLKANIKDEERLLEEVKNLRETILTVPEEGVSSLRQDSLQTTSKKLQEVEAALGRTKRSRKKRGDPDFEESFRTKYWRLSDEDREEMRSTSISRFAMG